MAEEKKSTKNDKNYWMSFCLKIFAESTGWIAFPVIGALFLGRWLDVRYNSEPLFFLGLTIFAFVISSVGIGITGVKYMKIIEEDEKHKNTKAQKTLKHRNTKISEKTENI